MIYVSSTEKYLGVNFLPASHLKSTQIPRHYFFHFCYNAFHMEFPGVEIGWAARVGGCGEGGGWGGGGGVHIPWRKFYFGNIPTWKILECED